MDGPLKYFTTEKAVVDFVFFLDHSPSDVKKIM